jgi:SAM-dependent methyltransferase
MFEGAASGYDAFIGRYSRLLAGQMADLAGVAAGDRAIDVGCGPGALTVELVARLGADHVAAVDPSESFVAAARERLPGVDVRRAAAESLPFAEAAFDAALAQLVVHFMTDPVVGIREMARVTRPGGAVVACVWDIGGGRSPLTPFWAAARSIDPGAPTEMERAGTHAGQLDAIFRAAGLEGVEESEIRADTVHPDFEDWWVPFEIGAGPVAPYMASLDVETKARIRERARAMLPSGPVPITARAWAARGRVAGR